MAASPTLTGTRLSLRVMPLILVAGAVACAFAMVGCSSPGGPSFLSGTILVYYAQANAPVDCGKDGSGFEGLHAGSVVQVVDAKQRALGQIVLAGGTAGPGNLTCEYSISFDQLPYSHEYWLKVGTHLAGGDPSPDSGWPYSKLRNNGWHFQVTIGTCAICV